MKELQLLHLLDSAPHPIELLVDLLVESIQPVFLEGCRDGMISLLTQVQRNKKFAWNQILKTYSFTTPLHDHDTVRYGAE